MDKSHKIVGFAFVCAHYLSLDWIGLYISVIPRLLLTKFNRIKWDSRGLSSSLRGLSQTPKNHGIAKTFAAHPLSEE